MRAGKLRHSVVVQSPVKTRNDHGEMVVSWTDRGTVRCSIEQVSGSEVIHAKQVKAVATQKVGMRFDSALQITSGWRLKWDDDHSAELRYLNIDDVNNVEGRNRELILLCQEAK